MRGRTKISIYTTMILLILSVFDMITTGSIEKCDIARNLELISREVEHNEDSIRKLNKFFSKKGSY